jgi:hypothetical protein
MCRRCSLNHSGPTRVNRYPRVLCFPSVSPSERSVLNRDHLRFDVAMHLGDLAFTSLQLHPAFLPSAK